MRWIWRTVRRALVFLRDLYDRIRHPGRRRSALMRLRDLSSRPGSVRSVLFVCLGNVCRSPYAEWSLRESMGQSAPKLVIDSSGFIGPDRPPPETAVQVARERGIDHGANVSKLTTPEMLLAADVVFVFERSHLRKLKDIERKVVPSVFLLGDFDPEWESKRSIVDPWGRPADEFRRVFARIDRCLESVRVHLLTDANRPNSPYGYR